MSKNQPEISEKELEQVSGGAMANTSPDLMKLQDLSNKATQSVDAVSSFVKKINDISNSIIQFIK